MCRMFIFKANKKQKWTVAVLIVAVLICIQVMLMIRTTATEGDTNIVETSKQKPAHIPNRCDQNRTLLLLEQCQQREKKLAADLEAARIMLQRGREASSVGCRLEFVRYESSPWEKYWLENIDNLQHLACEAINSQMDKVMLWVHGAAYLLKNGSALFDPNSVSSEVFSKFHHKIICEDGRGGVEEKALTSWIEPLAGLNRHPLFCQDPMTYRLSAATFVPMSLENDDLRATFSDNHMYFDAGAGNFISDSRFGVSQGWFYETYQRRAVQWTRFFGWEASRRNPVEIYAQVPAEAMPIYTFLNIPCSADKNSQYNPLNFIRKLTKPKDFVVFKLDIDTPHIENRIMEQVLNEPEWRVLIDEMFFEHHVDVKEMRTYGWGDLSATGLTLKNSYLTFFSMRKHGVRMHSWF